MPKTSTPVARREITRAIEDGHVRSYQLADAAGIPRERFSRWLTRDPSPIDEVRALTLAFRKFQDKLKRRKPVTSKSNGKSGR